MQKIKRKNFVVCPAVCTKGNIELLHVDEFPKTGSDSLATYQKKLVSEILSIKILISFILLKNLTLDTFSRKITQAERLVSPTLRKIERNSLSNETYV